MHIWPPQVQAQLTSSLHVPKQSLKRFALEHHANHDGHHLQGDELQINLPLLQV